MQLDEDGLGMIVNSVDDIFMNWSVKELTQARGNGQWNNIKKFLKEEIKTECLLTKKKSAKKVVKIVFLQKPKTLSFD